MTRLRVAHISYLNSVPFFSGMSDERIEMVDMHPRALGRAAEERRIDAGLMSIADTFRNPSFEPLGDLGIALDGPAHSVLLFSAGPVEKLQGATIGITGETSTSYPLLRILLDGHFGVTPAAYARRLQGTEPGDDGILLIGDAALRRAAQSGLEPGKVDYGSGVIRLDAAGRCDEPFPHVLDLSAAWRSWQRLPFVFARWMVRRDVTSADRLMLAEVLATTFEANLRRLDSLAAENAHRANLSEAAAYAYLMGFDYRFGAEGETAIRRFRDLLESTQWWENAPPKIMEKESA